MDSRKPLSAQTFSCGKLELRIEIGESYGNMTCCETMRRLVLYSLLFSFAAGTMLASEPSGPHLAWVRDLDRAYYLAKRDKKFIIADLYTDWCTWCRVMEYQTYGDPGIVKDLGPRYVWLRLNAETEEDGVEAQRRFKISGYPATVIVEPEEGLYEKTQGFLSPEQFRQMVTHHGRTLGEVIDLRNRVRKHPEETQSKLKLADEYLQRRNYRRAEGIYRALIEQDGQKKGVDECYYWLALSLANQGKEGQAVRYLNQMRERFPNSEFAANAMGLQGEIHLNLGEDRKAARVWGEYLKRFPEHQMAERIRWRLKSMRE